MIVKPLEKEWNRSGKKPAGVLIRRGNRENIF